MDHDEIWQAVLGQLEVALSKASFTTWFKDTFIFDVTGEVATVGVPNGFAKEWLEKKYAPEITAALRQLLPDVSAVRFKVANRPLNAPAPSFNPPAPVLRAVERSVARVMAGEETLNPRYIFETFVVGNSNRLAHAAAVAVAQNPGAVHNPLFLYGGVGLGKTHLVHAIGNEIRLHHPDRSVLYVDCEQFTSEFIQALRSNTMDKFKKKYRDVDVFLVDDIQFLAAKEGTQEEFFHTFNALHQKNRQIVLTSDRVPKAIPQLEERLSSRFGWGLVADIQPPNFEMRVAVLRNKATEKSMVLDDATIEFLAENIVSNIRELEGVLNRLQGWCQLNGVDPSLAVAQEIITGFLGKRDLKSVTPPQLLAQVARFYSLPVEDLASPRRTAELVLPRQIAMYLLRTELGLSFPRIGQEMGGKDHTTVMHGVGRIDKERTANEKLREDLAALKKQMYGG